MGGGGIKFEVLDSSLIGLMSKKATEGLLSNGSSENLAGEFTRNCGCYIQEVAINY